MKRARLSLALSLASLACCSLELQASGESESGGCGTVAGNPGGANQGERRPGAVEGGTVLADGEIAVDARGRFFLTRAEGRLAYGDLSTGEIRRIPSMPPPTTLAFTRGESGGAGFYLYSEEEQRLLSFDLERGATRWSRSFRPLRPTLDVTPDGERLVLGAGDEVLVLDAATGETLASFDTGPITDLDLTPDGSRIVITGVTAWEAEGRPNTPISVFSASDGSALCVVGVPNCADELVLTADGARAFMAPTFCRRDPVSVIDLGEGCAFVENLPGFGPVALSPDGSTGVAFLDRDDADPLAPEPPAGVRESESRFHLMFFDVRTLEREAVALGDELPRYAFTPDGAMLLVDTTWSAESPLRLLDAGTRQLREVSGPPVRMAEFVLTPDAGRAYLLEEGLFELDVRAAEVTELPLPFVPGSLNITPDGGRLLLKEDPEGDVFVLALETRRVVATLRAPAR